MKMEREILESCIANLRALEGIKHVDLKERETGLPPGADAKLVLRTNAGQLAYVVEVKRIVMRAGLEHLIHNSNDTQKRLKQSPFWQPTTSLPN